MDYTEEQREGSEFLEEIKEESTFRFLSNEFRKLKRDGPADGSSIMLPVSVFHMCRVT